MTLPFHPGQGNALEEVALGEEEDCDYRQHHEERAGHQHADAGAGAGLERLNLESVKAEGEGIEPLIAQVDERPHEIVPGPEESKNGNHGQGWTYQRQHNMPVNAEKTAAI